MALGSSTKVVSCSSVIRLETSSEVLSLKALNKSMFFKVPLGSDRYFPLISYFKYGIVFIWFSIPFEPFFEFQLTHCSVAYVIYILIHIDYW